VRAVSPRLLARQLVRTSMFRPSYLDGHRDLTTVVLRGHVAHTHPWRVTRSGCPPLPKILDCCHPTVSGLFSVPVWRITLSCPLPVIGLVDLYSTNDLRGHSSSLTENWRGRYRDVTHQFASKGKSQGDLHVLNARPKLIPGQNQT